MKLLQSHAVEKCREIRARLMNKQVKYTIGFHESEALAFLQWWARIPLMPGSLSQVAVHQVIALIDRVSKNSNSLRLEMQYYPENKIS